MNDYESIANARETYQLAQIQFINTELDLGITFCQVAKATTISETKTRNIKNAHLAFETAIEYLREAPIPISARELLLYKIHALETLLAECNES